MKKSNLCTIAGDYWFFHAIGTGVIFTYQTKAKQISVTCNATGKIINTIDRYKDGGFNSPEQFMKEAREIYLFMVEVKGDSMDLNFYEHPTYVGDSMIEMDFKLLLN